MSRPEPARRGILDVRSRLRLTFRFPRAYPPGRMSNAARALSARGRFLPFLLLAAACLVPLRAASQTFAAGGGGSLSADLGTHVVDDGFNNWGGYVFGEMALGGFGERQSGLLQLRFAYTTLPGGAPDAPDIDAWSGMALVFYRFQEFWWEAGFFGGVGVFRILPKIPQPGQVPADPTQTVVGFQFGVQTVFRVTRQFDVRLELSGEIPNTEYSHSLITLTTAVGYRF
jgi:hypothetical protein